MSISSHSAETEPTLLDHWKALARIENSRARQNWDKLEPGEEWEIIGDPEIIQEPTKQGSEKKTARSQRNAQIKALAEAGVSIKDISERIGVSDQTVRNAVNALSSQWQEKRKEEEAVRKQRNDQITTWFDAGISAREICARTKLSEAQVYRVLNKRGPVAQTENKSSEDRPHQKLCS